MITYLNEILWAGSFGMQAATELLFSHENFGIYLKLHALEIMELQRFYWKYLSFDLQFRKA